MIRSEDEDWVIGKRGKLGMKMNTNWCSEKEEKKPCSFHGASVLSLNSEEEAAVGDFTERKE